MPHQLPSGTGWNLCLASPLLAVQNRQLTSIGAVKEEEPRWRPGRSLDPSAQSPATPRYSSRRPPSGLAVTAGTAAWLGETGAFNSRCERSPDLVRGESGTRRSASGAARGGGSCGCSTGRALTGCGRFPPPRLPATGRAGEARLEEDCAVCPAGRPGTPTRRAGAPF
ncbi:hypothetical protein NDU88_000710 [Pleurodeles waltl]|uniref:Uncharacterized protein n=1 Tax=Pleurodeles waltl TaxID=8319 RepID=A0AAV7LDV1_PLEWA|nr:hypothetical protein NDU88_000710 [Pleurodeles waltl]